MKIAICDDETRDRELLCNYISNIDSSLTVKLFASAAELLAILDDDFFEIILMDIEMDPPNGYDIAEKLVQQHDKPLIIFVTKSNDYTIRGYGIAFRYIRKPVDFESFKNVFCCALNEVVPQKLPISSNGKTIILSIKDIIYFEVYGHELKIHLLNDTHTCRGVLSEIIKTLSGTHFAQVHKSFFVNLAYIYRIESKCITMIDGSTIPLSVLRKERFMEQFNLFLRG